MLANSSLIPSLRVPESRLSNSEHERLRIVAMATLSSLDALISTFQLADQCLDESKPSEFKRKHRARFEDGSPASCSQQLTDISKRLYYGETRASLLREPAMTQWFGDAIMVARSLGLWHAAIRQRAGMPRNDAYGSLTQINERLGQVYGVTDLGSIKKRIEILERRALADKSVKKSSRAKRPAEQLLDDADGSGDGRRPPERYRKTRGGRVGVPSTSANLSTQSTEAHGTAQSHMGMANVAMQEGDDDDEEEEEEQSQPKVLDRACIDGPFPFVIDNSDEFQDAWKTLQALENRLEGSGGGDDEKDLDFMRILLRELCEYANVSRKEYKLTKVLRDRRLRSLRFRQSTAKSKILKLETELEEMKGKYCCDELGFEEAIQRAACIKSLKRLCKAQPWARGGNCS